MARDCTSCREAHEGNPVLDDLIGQRKKENPTLVVGEAPLIDLPGRDAAPDYGVYVDRTLHECRKCSGRWLLMKK